VVAVPSVGDNPWPEPGCWDYDAGNDDHHHAADIINLTHTLLKRTALNIDSAQVYVVGLSSGGALSLLLGCKAPDLYAGIGAISGPSVGSAQTLATEPVPKTNADDAAVKCNALAGEKSSFFATQVANIAYGDMDKNGPDADFPYTFSPDDTNHPGQYAVVSVNWSDDNIRMLRSIYGASALGAAINIQSNLGVERDASTNGRTQLAELVVFNVGHAWPAGTGQPNRATTGGLWIAQSGLAYPQYIVGWFIRNNLRAK
jgi:poly(3-hydroxybutyrate) depolymerase